MLTFVTENGTQYTREKAENKRIIDINRTERGTAIVKIVYT